jgi:hypothetical protein
VILKPVKVECYAGSKADERPEAIIIDGERREVTRLLAERLERYPGPGGREFRWFKVLLDRETMDLVQDDSGNWFCRTG